MKFGDMARNATQDSIENPLRAAAIVGGGVAITVPAVVAGPALAASRFTAVGIQAGSLAAGVQSGIGSVAAGSAFSTLQSAAMGGYGVPIVHGVIQGAGAPLSATTSIGVMWTQDQKLA